MFHREPPKTPGEEDTCIKTNPVEDNMRGGH